eukprot:NODE_3849_length_872_cov_84.744836_g3198_i0.p2 GENE.NODE_3849_length_872_cov_84.744836_g3198_i0~~NODE_3849_length_872_cov_84.744836_g3198_i0.p2  ORF type:complete len:92 (-),score=1.56 NODE_3849_length_872_cov_84.744836_g3198_i0:371-646(-)
MTEGSVQPQPVGLGQTSPSFPALGSEKTEGSDLPDRQIRSQPGPLGQAGVQLGPLSPCWSPRVHELGQLSQGPQARWACERSGASSSAAGP